jgi:hypothetical protein
MELEKIERFKELIAEREKLQHDLKTVKEVGGSIGPKYLVFRWDSDYERYIEIPHEKKREITDFIEKILNKELDGVNNWILDL